MLLNEKKITKSREIVFKKQTKTKALLKELYKAQHVMFLPPLLVRLFRHPAHHKKSLRKLALFKRVISRLKLDAVSPPTEINAKNKYSYFIATNCFFLEIISQSSEVLQKINEFSTILLKLDFCHSAILSSFALQWPSYVKTF